MMTILFTFIILIGLPLLFIVLLWRASFNSKLQWLLDAVVTILLISWLFQAGNWGWISYYFRFLLPVFLLLTLYYSWKKVRILPFTTSYKKSEKFTLAIYFVLILVFGSYNMATLKSYTTSDQAIELQFPLQNGHYYVGQGGNHSFMNYHQIAPPQKYALDILKVNYFGARAKGLYPKQLEKYYIYKDELVSPCDGKVLELENKLVDFDPPNSDPENPTGNFVKLLCDHHDAEVYLAHMQEGSVAVSTGDDVKAGQPIGRVGNSGNTTEPHLHIHAEYMGEGVPITFDGKFLVRNSLVKK